MIGLIIIIHSAEATSAYMGNGGTTSGDPTPGSITTVQHTTVPWGCATERDWRCIFYILSCDIISFKAVANNKKVKIDWTVFCRQEADHFIVERSTDNQNFSKAAFVTGIHSVNEIESYIAIDNISAINEAIIYYRLRTVFRNGKESITSTILLHRLKTTSDIQIRPNPVTDKLQLLINSKVTSIAKISLLDGTGKIINSFTEKLQTGNNTFVYTHPAAIRLEFITLRARLMILY